MDLTIKGRLFRQIKDTAIHIIFPPIYSTRTIDYFGIKYYRKYIFEFGENFGNFTFKN